MPSVTGVEEETNDPEDLSWDKSPPTPTVTPQQDRLSKENIPQATVSKNFVQPASFYGQLPKKQLIGPLLAFCTVKKLSFTLILGTIRTLTARWS